MSEKFSFEVFENETGVRLDKFLSEKFLLIKPEITRSKLQNLIEEKLVCDGQERVIENASYKTKIGEKFSITLPDPKPSHLTAKEIPFEIIFEDADLLVINKPAGLTVHPGAGNHDDTLVNALLFTHGKSLSNIGGEFRPGVVHRLDKDTSGLMLIAKNDFTHQALSEKMRLREIKRTYLAFIYGALTPAYGVINKNIVRSRNNRLKMTISRTIGRNAITYYETKKVFLDGFASMIECRLETGRTHQIRVHFESIKHSLLGDQLYNSCRKNPPKELATEIKNFVQNFPRQALHSYRISFVHPRSEEEMSFEIPLPQDLEMLKTNLENG
jgi:23S rRNA pseudouridine1911/1915/1917 synthase